MLRRTPRPSPTFSIGVMALVSDSDLGQPTVDRLDTGIQFTPSCYATQYGEPECIRRYPLPIGFVSQRFSVSQAP